MTIETYRLLHFAALFLTFVALGALSGQAARGGPREAWVGRRALLGLHGIGLTLGLISGFGLLARLGLTGAPPGWAWAKLLVWIALGAAPAVFSRSPRLAQAAWLALPLLGLTLAALGRFKPF
jgi:hypothetical protein